MMHVTLSEAATNTTANWNLLSTFCRAIWLTTYFNYGVVVDDTDSYNPRLLTCADAADIFTNTQWLTFLLLTAADYVMTMQAATAACEDVYNPKHYTLLIAAAAAAGIIL